MTRRSIHYSISYLLFFLISATVARGQNEKLSDPQWVRNSGVTPVPAVYEQTAFHYPKQTVFQLILPNGYASSTLDPLAPGAHPENSTITRITLYFTAYPKSPEAWITAYDGLLTRRWQALFALDSQFYDPNITYRVVLQTGCEDEARAKRLFHGFVIDYWLDEWNASAAADSLLRLKSEEIPPNEVGELSQPDTIAGDTSALPLDSTSTLAQVLEFIQEHGGQPDSVVLRALDQLTSEGTLSVVCDWTGSMYGYSANAVLWHLLNPEHSAIEQFSFFNDGNRKKRNQKAVGKTGGIYHRNTTSLNGVVQLFNRVIARGRGGDSPENDVEAVLATQNEFPATTGIVLIADNRSCIRDITLTNRLKVPVNIVLCGTENGINAQYIQLARQTDGQVFLLEFRQWLNPQTAFVLSADSAAIQYENDSLTLPLVFPCDRSRVTKTKRLQWLKGKKKRRKSRKALRRKKLFTFRW